MRGANHLYKHRVVGFVLIDALALSIAVKITVREPFFEVRRNWGGQYPAPITGAAHLVLTAERAAEEALKDSDSCG
jgi:hypothetical protein